MPCQLILFHCIKKLISASGADEVNRMMVNITTVALWAWNAIMKYLYRHCQKWLRQQSRLAILTTMACRKNIGVKFWSEHSAQIVCMLFSTNNINNNNTITIITISIIITHKFTAAAMEASIKIIIISATILHLVILI